MLTNIVFISFINIRWKKKHFFSRLHSFILFIIYWIIDYVFLYIQWLLLLVFSWLFIGIDGYGMDMHRKCIKYTNLSIYLTWLQTKNVFHKTKINIRLVFCKMCFTDWDLNQLVYGVEQSCLEYWMHIRTKIPIIMSSEQHFASTLIEKDSGICVILILYLKFKYVIGKK